MITILLIAGPVIGFMIGVLVGRGNPDSQLDKAERRELESYRDQEMELTAKASEHAALGDDFGVIALDILNNNRKTRQIGRKNQ